PEAQVLEMQRSEAAVLEQGVAGIDAVVHAVGALHLEEVRAQRLGGSFLGLEIGQDRLVDESYRLLEGAPALAHRAELRIQGAAIRLDPLAHLLPVALQVLEKSLD